MTPLQKFDAFLDIDHAFGVVLHVLPENETYAERAIVVLEGGRFRSETLGHGYDTKAASFVCDRRDALEASQKPS